MKKIFLIILISLGLLVPAYGGLIVDLPLETDLVDKKGSLGTGAFARSSAATYVHDGVLYTADGDDTPFSNASVETEAGATEMRGSFVDGQAWFHDAGGLIAVYAGTGNLFIGLSGTEYVYGFLGEVGTGETLGAEELDDPTLNDAAEWDSSDANITHDDVAGTVTWDGLGGALFYTTDGSGLFTVGKLYEIVVVIDSITAGSVYVTYNSGAFRGTATPSWTTAGTKTIYRICSDNSSINLWGCGTCDAVISNISVKEVTEPAATAVHIYKEHGLLNEGWNAVDTGIDYNAGASWDFDVYVNLMSSAGGTAQPRFEDGWLLVEPEATNWLLGTEWNTGNGTDVSVADDDGYLRHDGAIEDFAYVEGDGGADITVTVDAESMNSDSTARSLKIVITNDGDSADDVSVSNANNLSIVNTEDYTLSFWIKTSTTEASIPITYENGTNDTFATVAGVWTFVEETYTATASANDENFVIQLGNIGAMTVYIESLQFEHTSFSTSWIPTKVIPVTRTTEAGDASDNGASWDPPTHGVLEAILSDSIPPAAMTDSQGTLTFDVEWGCDESDIEAGTYGLISVIDGADSLAFFNAINFRATDESLTSDIAHPAFSVGDTINYVVRWGDVDGAVNKLSVGYSDDAGTTWTFGASVNYDGDFDIDDKLRLVYSSLYPIQIRNIRFYDVAYTQAQIAAGLERNMVLWMLPFEFP